MSREVVLVAGATGGVGKPLTMALLERGFAVVGTARRTASLDQMREEVLARDESWASRFARYRLDLMSGEDLSKTPQGLANRFEDDPTRLSHVVFAVGLSSWNLNSMLDEDPLSKDGQRSMDAYYKLFVSGLVELVRVVLPLMKDGGSITVIGSSISAVRPEEVPDNLLGGSGYAAIKKAQDRMVRFLRRAKKVQGRGVLIHYPMFPGVLDTAFHTTASVESQLPGGTTTAIAVQAILDCMNAKTPQNVVVPKAPRAALGL